MSRRMRWVGHMEHMGKERKVYNILVGKVWSEFRIL
jgi:hypothetical protein